MAKDSWTFKWEKAQPGRNINRAGVLHFLNSPEIAAAVEQAANRSAEGNKKYVNISRIPERVGIRGQAPDRVGYKVEINHETAGHLHLRHRANILRQIARKRVRKLARSERKSRARTTKKVA